MPIDIFFSSLAEVHQNHAIGIILSGTGEDGTAGLKKIKDQGGITFAQDMNLRLLTICHKAQSKTKWLILFLRLKRCHSITGAEKYFWKV